MKFAADRPWSDPEKAARKLLEIANDVEAVQDGRIYIELINAPFLFREHATPAEYSAGLKLAIERGWLVPHESGTFVKLTQDGADLFAWMVRCAATYLSGKDLFCLDRSGLFGALLLPRVIFRSARPGRYVLRHSPQPRRHVVRNHSAGGSAGRQQ